MLRICAGHGRLERSSGAGDGPPTGRDFSEKIKTVALVAPACPAHSSEALDRAIAGLKKAGIRVKLMPHAREGNRRPGMKPLRWQSGSPIWNRRGSIRRWIWSGASAAEPAPPDVVKKLDWEKLRRRPDLPLLGFSDITALQLAMLKERAGHPFTAPSALGLLTVDAPSLENFRRAMHGKSAEPVQLVPIRGGEVSGLALAGHLRLLETMNRTRFRPDTAGRVIFIESPDYLPDQVRASLGRLREEGFFKDCAAVVFGTLSRCGDREAAVIEEFADTVKCPVYRGFPLRAHAAQPGDRPARADHHRCTRSAPPLRAAVPVCIRSRTETSFLPLKKLYFCIIFSKRKRSSESVGECHVFADSNCFVTGKSVLFRPPRCGVDRPSDAVARRGREFSDRLPM
ncbi:MAG: LD-carboxypeptidase [Lentisphaeria bacterium]|nr:MAG: LD-carboxypeptidase [Lentisphaeria bacterium]